MKRESQIYGSVDYKEKTKIMVLDRDRSLPKTNLPSDYERVGRINYPSSVVKKDGGSTDELLQRIAITRDVLWSWLLSGKIVI